MSTRSYIGYTKDGKEVKYVYCHWDGYIEHNGVLLQKYYNESNVEQLVNGGDMSILGHSLSHCKYYRDEDNGAQTMPMEEYQPDGMIEYCYLFDFNTNSWMVWGWDEDDFVKLKDKI